MDYTLAILRVPAFLQQIDGIRYCPFVQVYAVVEHDAVTLLLGYVHGIRARTFHWNVRRFAADQR